MDPDQTAPVSTMFASMRMLNSHFQMQLFCLRFKDQIMAEVVAQDDTVTFE